MKVTSLDFSQRISLQDLGQDLVWPDFAPALAWGEWLICERPGTALVLSPEENPLIPVLKSLLPRLGLTGICRLGERLSDGPLRDWARDQVFQQLLLAYGLRAHSDVIALFSVLSKMSPQVQAWVDQKGFGARDLYPLLSLNLDENACGWLEHLSQSSLSKSQATQLIEWASDLVLLHKKTWVDLRRQNVETPEKWHSRLRQTRFPESEQRQSLKQKKVSELPWPRHTEGQWKRDGDQDGLQVRFEAYSPEELKTRWQSLSKIIEQLHGEESLWKY